MSIIWPITASSSNLIIAERCPNNGLPPVCVMLPKMRVDPVWADIRRRLSYFHPESVEGGEVSWRASAASEYCVDGSPRLHRGVIAVGFRERSPFFVARDVQG